VILGGGFGGLTAADELRDRLGVEHEIVVIDRSPSFMMGLRKLWELVGLGSMAEGSRDRAILEGRGIRFLQREILSLDPSSRRVETDGGPIDGAYLVVALGAEPRPDLVPGLAEHGHDVWSPAGVPGMRAALDGFDGGEIAIVITGVPYACPPAPFECAMLLDDYLRQRGLRERSGIVVSTLKPILLPNAGPEGSAWLADQLTARGIRYHTSRTVQRVEAGRVLFEDGDLGFDLLVGVPPHRPPSVIAGSELSGPGGWVHVDPASLGTDFEGVYAIGDVTKIGLANGLALPKAGVMAELEGRRVAAAIAAAVTGAPSPPPFDGRGYCFLEMGTSSAAFIEGEFFATPEPRVFVRAESREHAEEKHRFEAERLQRWFGS
jgi:sulfide:quinone oxidoreductase